MFISAQRGIGLDELRAQTLALVESDYVDRLAILPVSKPKARAHVHSVAEVIEEDFGYAQDAYDADAGPVPVVRLRFRASVKNAPDLDRMLERFGALRWTGDGSGDGALVTMPDHPA